MKRLIAALALTPLLATAGLAQSVTEEVGQQLWCGTALVMFFTEGLPPDLTEAEKAEAQGYVEGGQALLEIAIQAHLDAGYTQEEVDKIAADLKPVVMQQIQSNTAQYGFEDCLAIVPERPEPAAPAGSDMSSSEPAAMAPSSEPSSAM